jgi:hypothetical protein
MKALLWKFVVAAVALHAGLAWAGTQERLGTGGASELRIPVGARSVGLAWSNVGSVTGAEALFGNPAGLAAGENRTEVLFSYSRYIADMNLNYLALSQKLGDFGTLGFAAKVLSIGDIIRTTETAPDGTGDVFRPTLSTFSVTFAKSLTDRVNFGGTIDYVSESVLQTKAGGVAFDFGFQYDTGLHGVRLGMAMKSFGGSQQFGGADFETNQQFPQDDPQAANRTVALTSAEFELPSLFAGGASWPVLQGVNSLTLHGLYQSNSFGVDEFRVGGEYLWHKDFAARVGYKATSNKDDLFGLSYGVGVRAPFGGSSMFIDYAGQTVSDFFGDVHHVSLMFTF